MKSSNWRTNDEVIAELIASDDAAEGIRASPRIDRRPGSDGESPHPA
jgi:hypothetical protein